MQIINIYCWQAAIWSGQMVFIFKVYRREAKDEKGAK